MKSGKDIDSIYREKFTDAKVAPPDDAWDNIVSRLPEKEEERVFPLWIKLTGTAAVLALLLTVSYSLFETSPQPGFSVVEKGGGQPQNISVEATSTFNEHMFNASLLLQSLMMETRNMQERQQLSTGEKGIASGMFANIIEAPEHIVLPNNQAALSEVESDTPGFEPATAQEERTTLADADISPFNSQEDEAETPASEERKMEKRLSITTKIAPLYFDNFGGGSTIDRQFAQHESAGEVSLSYGINVAYQVSEKVKIRSGISKVALNYNTGDISFNEAVSSASIEGTAEFVTLSSPVRGRLNQQLGFLEVPVEIEYALLKKKIGLNLIGGGSALFLGENRVYLDSPDFTTDLGEAQNLNNVSFSTNIGIGMDYNFSPQFQFSVEPVLKLQLNTFRDVSGLNPYYFGIYSGFSYRF